MRYRKKPVVIEARQWDGEPDTAAPILEWIIAEGGTAALHEGPYDGLYHLLIHTLEGSHLAGPRDWIIRGIQGEFYPCKPDIFEATYEVETAQIESAV